MKQIPIDNAITLTLLLLSEILFAQYPFMTAGSGSHSYNTLTISFLLVLRLKPRLACPTCGAGYFSISVQVWTTQLLPSWRARDGGKLNVFHL